MAKVSSNGKATKKKTSKKKASKKRGSVKRPEQTSSEHLGAKKKIALIETSIKELIEAQDQRMSWGKVEKERRETLTAALKKHGFKAGDGGGYKRGPFEAWILVTEEKTKARMEVPDDGKKDDEGKKGEDDDNLEF